MGQATKLALAAWIDLSAAENRFSLHGMELI
jgi:hypothetical protein